MTWGWVNQLRIAQSSHAPKVAHSPLLLLRVQLLLWYLTISNIDYFEKTHRKK